MKVIGLTGGIGVGKSKVSEYLSRKGFMIIDADVIAREVVEPGSDIMKEIEKAFGKEYVLPDGSLNRKKLGEAVFKDAKNKQTLDNIMMKEIIHIIRQKIRSATQNVIVDAALLFEVGLDKEMDMVWLVDADEKIRIRRVCDRDGISEEEVLQRISMQMKREDKISKADVVINNSGSEEELYRQIDMLIKDYV